MATLTNKDYCDYDTCVALKELGYPLTSKEVRYEGNAVFVPGVLLYSAQKWLREEKEIAVFVIYDKNTSKWFATVINMDSLETINTVRYDLYEEALLEGVKCAVKILEEDETIHE